ncbi:pyruvate, water dikinase regulatory protein [Facklamia miroungae]|uniref:Putative pyruvate, phosphate dikinase regulatory protein n=1 Tax=Facklamia miroungae TaxID=120956 RepID=A0A1G7RNL5_9LACT|nr:pyruvate, water dikinase regulatory protein [Facklamia miroungae]NKZ29344.1 kinase/pyrophosphorylase [Facklamia miroungae]SDG12253.1 hypothetical protein SAMN05421791_103110 [Facklamia miroungae]
MPVTNTYKFYVISDSVGETALRATNAALAQFPKLTNISLKRFPFINTMDELKPILEEAAKVNAIIITTLVDEGLEQFASEFSKDNALEYHNVIHPILDLISQKTNMMASEKSGTLHRLDDHYFDRIQAIEFAVKYDDGKNKKGFELADIVLLGVSRSSKTPLSMYLANKSYKVANLPIFPEVHIPDEIYQADARRIFGLIASPLYIQNIRKKRVEMMGLGEKATYSSLERVKQELMFADDLYHQLNATVINVENQSIEELAEQIIGHYNKLLL